ncbi:MAG: hypothetical protein ACLQG3_02555 [Terracidiphilus sp.]
MWLYLGMAAGLALPILFGLVEFCIERKQFIVLSPQEWILNPDWRQSGQRYLLGPNLVDFVPRMQQYTKIAEIMITLASASIIFIPSHVNTRPSLAFSVALLGFAVLWGVLFIAWMSYCYEQALYNPANFNAAASSTMFGLGFGALSCFALAYIALAFQIALAVANRQAFT